MDIRDERIAAFCRERSIRLMVLFGSRAAGQVRASSDTDVAVLTDAPPATLDERFALEADLEGLLGVEEGRLDLVVINQMESVTLGREIARTGRVLYDRDGEQWPSFVSLALRMYADFEPFRRLRDKVLRGEPIE